MKTVLEQALKTRFQCRNQPAVFRHGKDTERPGKIDAVRACLTPNSSRSSPTVPVAASAISGLASLRTSLF